MNPVACMVRDALHGLSPSFTYPRYLKALSDAFDVHEPLYGRASYGDTYRGVSIDAQWMALSLVTNAEREGDGATRLWSLAACTPQEDVAVQVKQHAVDESRHAKAYLRLLDLTFPNSTEPEFRRDLEGLSPGYTMHMDVAPVPGSAYAHAVTLDDFVQMNIAEIRTRIHHLLQRPMLQLHCDAQHWPQLERILQSLLFDETVHIQYTASLIEKLTETMAPGEFDRLMQERVADFNDVTRQELGKTEFV